MPETFNFRVINCKTILWRINIICFLQACYGLCQYIGWFLSNHSKFAIAGSFDNPAGFTAVLSLAFPFGLFLSAKTKKVEWYLTVAGLAVIAAAIFLSGARTGVLAIIISSVIFLLFDTNIVSKFRQFKNYKLLTSLIMICFVVSLSILYHLKKDSANGRLLIWKISSEMIKDKPVLGHGFGAFQASYMDYQAEYFKNSPNSKYAQLADNVKHPFNEFIKVAVEFGIVGLIVVLLLFLFVLWKIVKSENENRGLVFSGLASILVLACFSYPLQYIAVWLLLVFYLLALLTPKEIRIRNTPVSIITRIVIVFACTFSFFNFSKQIQAEIKWKAIAVNSLRGNTEKMLPEYEMLYSTSLKRNPYFLYNYGAELNFTGKFDKSIDILTECQQRFNDYDLQMLLADNYHRKGETEKAIQCYQHASNMIPCRFLPTYQLFEIYKETGEKGKAVKYADEIINKKVKVPSVTVSFIQREASEFLTAELKNDKP
ncbi:O-antigen ligase family protein [Mangrovibacterium marinum]|uniref:O-antigen ligase family protein n=1 Tax=Mangrovibacterium marinum TaxID=1639118 RepID=UPI002A18B4B3|nr:O-antigen ligase family protein [Mangrovibacterium marinum]